jgi:hypothetical protein
LGDKEVFMWKKGRMWGTGVVLSLILTFALGWMTAQDFPLDDKREQLGTEFYIMGRIEPMADQQFPKKWGSLVSFAAPGAASAPGSTLVFEADDGTIRIVRVVVNWTTYKVESASVFTFGRE